MILYFHGFSATNPRNYERVIQLQFIDSDVRLITYSTQYPRRDFQHLLKEVSKHLQLTDDQKPLLCGEGLGGYWAERVGFLTQTRQVILNPNLFPEENMVGKINRPEEYQDISTKCVKKFRQKNEGNCLVILSKFYQKRDNHRSANVLSEHYPISWDENEELVFENLGHHLHSIKTFKLQ